MYSVKETTYFQKEAQRVWTIEEKNEFITWIASNPLEGDVIPQTGGLRKVRWSRSGSGKSGGARVIYWNQLDDGTIILITVYAKSVADNLSQAFLKALKQLEES
jgi:hypothetical protein